MAGMLAAPIQLAVERLARATLAATKNKAAP
jgi:hypothetical protein